MIKKSSAYIGFFLSFLSFVFTSNLCISPEYLSSRRTRQIDFNQRFDSLYLKQQAADLLDRGLSAAVDNSSLLSTWRHIFNNYSGEKFDISISLGRGQGAFDTETISLPKNLSLEYQVKFVALYIANELITQGAGAIEIQASQELKDGVRALFDPYFDVNTGSRKDKIAVEIMGNNGNSTTLDIEIPDDVKSFNYSALNVPQEKIEEFAKNISQAIINQDLSVNAVDEIVVYCDYYTFAKLKKIVQGEDSELAAKLVRYEYYDSVAGYIMERYSSYFVAAAKNEHLFDLNSKDLGTAISEQVLPSGFVFDRSQGTFLGLDIGASSIKLQIVKISETGEDRIFEGVVDEKLNSSPGISLQQVIENILNYDFKYQSSGEEKVIKLKDVIGDMDIKGIGVSWPGGVLDNRIVATSKILKGINEYDIDGVEGVSNFAGLLSEIFSKELEYEHPIPVALINDGDAGAFGIAGGENDVLGIILGTSIAGGYIGANGSLTPFVGELGKLIFDMSSTFIKSSRNLPESSVYVASEGLKNLVSNDDSLKLEMVKVVKVLIQSKEVKLNKDQPGINSIEFSNLDNSQIGIALRSLIDNDNKDALKIEEVIGVYLAEVIVEAQRHYGAGNVMIAGGILKALPHLEQHTKARLEELSVLGVSGINPDNVIFGDADTRYAGARGAAQWVNLTTQLQRYPVYQQNRE